MECTVSVLAEFVDILIVVLIKKMFKLPVSIYVWSTEVLWDNVYVYNTTMDTWLMAAESCTATAAYIIQLL